MKSKNQRIVKWSLYALILLLLYTMQTTPGLFSIMGIQPVLIVPLAVSVSFFERELAGGIFGVVTGLLWDISAGKLLGYSAIILMFCCVAAALLSMYLVRANVLNGIWICASTITLYLLIDFNIYYALWGYAGLGTVAANMAFMALYTTAVMAPVFLLVKKIHRKLTLHPDE